MQTYNEAKAIQDSLYSDLDAISEILKPFPRDSNGLVIESVRVTDEYKVIKGQYQAAFAKLQNFNKVFVKTYKKEIRENRKYK